MNKHSVILLSTKLDVPRTEQVHNKTENNIFLIHSQLLWALDTF